MAADAGAGPLRLQLVAERPGAKNNTRLGAFPGVIDDIISKFILE